MATLRSLLTEICEQWPIAVNETFKAHPLAKKFRTEFAEKVAEILADRYSHLSIKASPGAGQWANVAWLSMLDKVVTTTTQDGFYPVYLFKADGSGLYLSLIHGTTKPMAEFGKVKANALAAQRTAAIFQVVPKLKAWGGVTVELAASTSLGRSYEKANITAKYYSLSNMPKEEELISDLLELVNYYSQAKAVVITKTVNEDTTNQIDTTSLMMTPLPKPFILLAGVSGTGKSRFVHKQARKSEHLASGNNYELISVRPDWHEPADLFGYISHLGHDVAQYNVTDVLRFMVKAWLEIIDKVVDVDGELVWVGKPLTAIRPFWLCLDEMNLAPVEQYFADYLSVLETRKWLTATELETHNERHDTDHEYIYQCKPLLKPGVIGQLNDLGGKGKAQLCKDLGLDDEKHESLWQYFIENGISIPFNLIVAGTVNMDETTHSFSRKVIDRAMTLDFDLFYPNRFEVFFDQPLKPKTLTFPTRSAVTKADLVTIAIDPDGKKSINFLAAVNKVLNRTAFQLAYRALNELLLSVCCFDPQNENELLAVWDDFLMCKVLPRIDGDQEKLAVVTAQEYSDETLLDELEKCLKGQLQGIWAGERVDLLQEPVEGAEAEMVKCRSAEKLDWMKLRLKTNGFTSFWP
ncbi:MAG: DUF3578 domain-containing protein [Algicola sp.]|nr:DUF3578 domain-containing protein [Algicola sp.]